jgi:hypothetical protein
VASGDTLTSGLGAGPPAAEIAGSGLPERASVYWRARVDEAALRRSGRLWTMSTAWHTVPFVGAAILLAVLAPITIPVGVILVAHAWIIPELYASRGAGVLRPRAPANDGSERRALLLLGDLVGDPARRLHARTGLVTERGELGEWVVGEAGAVLVRPGARRANCYCVKAVGSDLPAADRIAHLLLALRCDERDFATVANLAFSGACWRLRRRMPRDQRPALDAARRVARATPAP